MAYRRAWNTRNITGLVYGEVQRSEPLQEAGAEAGDIQRHIQPLNGARNTQNGDSQQFQINPKLQEVTGDAVTAALGAVAGKPSGLILYAVRPVKGGEETTLHDMRQISAPPDLSLDLPMTFMSALNWTGPPAAQGGGLLHPFAEPDPMNLFPSANDTYPPPAEDHPARHEQRPTWPMDKALPFEIYEMILGILSRDDIKNLRSTCKEIEFRMSHALFETVVLPFNPEIYGMLCGTRRLDGSSKLPEFLRKGYRDPDLYIGHGLEVFKGFGPHIKKYGMSFEVDEGEQGTVLSSTQLTPRQTTSSPFLARMVWNGCKATGESTNGHTRNTSALAKRPIWRMWATQRQPCSPPSTSLGT